MERLSIQKLGPIEECSVDIKKYTVLTGPQASGKSTAAKSVFFFKNLKNLLYGIVIKQKTGVTADTTDTLAMTMKNRFMREIRKTFIQTFGTTWSMNPAMKTEYRFSEEKVVSIGLKNSDTQPNFLFTEISSALEDGLQRVEGMIQESSLADLRKECFSLFEDESEVIYIPAGRSMITLLSSQINYLYSVMDDNQRSSLDYCTQNYLERLLRMKDLFQNSPEEMVADRKATSDRKMNLEALSLAARYMRDILKGEYRSTHGEDRLVMPDGQYVKINFASSGQQEAVWILNVLFYQMLAGKKTYFIIEEPESHLYPETQKAITEFISLARQFDCGIMLTTHSPYVLGTLNNLLYASRISKSVEIEQLEKIINPLVWIDYDDLGAHYFQNGRNVTCADDEMKSIENEVIDGASEIINRDFERMAALKEGVCV